MHLLRTFQDGYREYTIRPALRAVQKAFQPGSVKRVSIGRGRVTEYVC